jgi:hypothetical protein
MKVAVRDNIFSPRETAAGASGVRDEEKSFVKSRSPLSNEAAKSDSLGERTLAGGGGGARKAL